MNNTGHLGSLQFRAETPARETVVCWALHSPTCPPGRSVGFVLAHHMFNHERGHHKVQVRKNSKNPSFAIFTSVYTCSPSLPDTWHVSRPSACTPKVPHSWQVWVENQLCGNCSPHDITTSVCGYPDISVITYQTDGEISTFSKKKAIFYGTS